MSYIKSRYLEYIHADYNMILYPGQDVLKPIVSITSNS